MTSSIENTYKNNSECEIDNFDQSTWDSAEDFLDREGLFILSPSTLFNQKTLNEFKRPRSQTILLGKSHSEKGEMINTKEIPTFLARRAKSAKSLGVLIQSNSVVENKFRF